MEKYGLKFHNQFIWFRQSQKYPEEYICTKMLFQAVIIMKQNQYLYSVIVSLFFFIWQALVMEKIQSLEMAGIDHT